MGALDRVRRNLQWMGEIMDGCERRGGDEHGWESKLMDGELPGKGGGTVFNHPQRHCWMSEVR